MPDITINIDEKLEKILNRRAKKNLLSLREQVEDIIRRSCVRSKNIPEEEKLDDRLVAIFSRSRRGRKLKRQEKDRFIVNKISDLIKQGRKNPSLKNNEEAIKTYKEIEMLYNSLLPKYKTKRIYSKILKFYNKIVK